MRQNRLFRGFNYYKLLLLPRRKKYKNYRNISLYTHSIEKDVMKMKLNMLFAFAYNMQ